MVEPEASCISEAVFRRESAVEYFKELVDGRWTHRASHRRTHRVLRGSLLTGFLQRPVAGDTKTEPLALRLAEALESGGMQQRDSLRQIGDVSLFISGFFADSLHRKLVDVDYYVGIGGFAYKALSRIETDTFSSVYAELAENFVGFVDVLSEVSERALVRFQCRSAAVLRNG